MQFSTEQHFDAAKQVRQNGAQRAIADRARFISMSNSLVVCARLAAKARGGLHLDDFDWSALAPDWSAIEQQIIRLTPFTVESPPIAPNLPSPR